MHPSFNRSFIIGLGLLHKIFEQRGVKDLLRKQQLLPALLSIVLLLIHYPHESGVPPHNRYSLLLGALGTVVDSLVNGTPLRYVLQNYGVLSLSVGIDGLR